MTQFTEQVKAERQPETVLIQTSEKFERHVDNSLRSLRRSNEAQSKTINRLLAMVEDLQERLNKAQKWAIKVNERIAAGQPDNADLVPAEDALGN